MIWPGGRGYELGRAGILPIPGGLLRNRLFKVAPFSQKSQPSNQHTLAFIKGFSRIVDPFNMGGSFSKIMNKLFANREMRILMLGLDAAGKTSSVAPCNTFLFSCANLSVVAILYKLKLNQQYESPHGHADRPTELQLFQP